MSVHTPPQMSGDHSRNLDALIACPACDALLRDPAAVLTRAQANWPHILAAGQ